MKHWCILLVAVVLSALLAQGAAACEPPQTVISVECSNTHFATSKIEPVARRDPGLLALETACAENIGELTPLLDREIAAWYRDDYRYWFEGGTRLIFEPHTSEREDGLLREQGQLTNCTYPVFSRVGEWLKVWTAEREYCVALISLSRCGSLDSHLSLASFIGYIVAHPDRHTALFLALLLLGVGLIVAAIIYRARRGQILTFVKPSPDKFVFPLLVGGLTICAGSLFDALLVVGVTYFIVAFLHPVYSPDLSVGKDIGG